jgi:photosynthetic reaction center cytochrome c subunit
VMHGFSHSLGVQCTFCHVEGAFDKDDKHEKKIARKMILMATEINTSHFHGQQKVTCWTCHRGSTEPETKPKE